MKHLHTREQKHRTKTLAAFSDVVNSWADYGAKEFQIDQTQDADTVATTCWDAGIPAWAHKLGAQKIINDINPKEQATQSAPHSIITSRVLKNQPSECRKWHFQDSKFQNFRAGHALEPTPRGFSRLRRSNIVTNSPLTGVLKLSLDTALK